MSISPIITFKAGLCDFDPSTDPPKVKPKPEPGYIYLYTEDDLVHFAWRPRSRPLDEPELDLLMIEQDGTFKPYETGKPDGKASTNGRIYILKFMSSSAKHFFWLQSRSQHQDGNPSWFSARDRKLGQIVNTLLQGEEIDVQAEIANIPPDQSGPDGDDDETMEDVEGHGNSDETHRGGSGGAGPDATGGDVREEGHESREGGADGGRAATASSSDPSSVIQNFLRSLGGGQNMQTQAHEKPFTTLPDLLTASSTLPIIEKADDTTVDHLLDFLPPQLKILALELDDVSDIDPNSEEARMVFQTLELEQKKEILRRVLHSPQFSQSLASLTVALRDGGLPSISEALKVKVENGGFMRKGGVPLGGGDAVEAFLEGVKKGVEEEDDADKMDTQ